MIVLKTALDFRPEHMQMYYGTKEEFEIKLKEDSPLVQEVLDLLNQKLNEDLSTELLLMESTEIDRNLYSFLRTLDILEEGMSFKTYLDLGSPKRELIVDDIAKDMISRFRLVKKPIKGMEVYSLTPLTDALQHGVVFYDYNILNEYIPDIINFLLEHGFAEKVEI